MSGTEKEKYKLKKTLKMLGTHRGRHTELISVYVPSGYDLNKVINQLEQEQGTATNIKSSSTKKNVISSLEKMIQHLRLYSKTPENGLAAFSGNVSEKEGGQDFQVWSIIPHVPLKVRIYRCDKEFILDPLQDMVEDKETYGLVVMDRRDGDVALLKGKTIIPVASASSNVPGKTRAGGQSAQRFERLREGAAKDFYNKIAGLMKDQFLGLQGLKGIIVGGPGPTKFDFVDGSFITNEVKKKIIAIKDLSYTGEFGLQELLDKSGDVLASEAIMQEKILMQRFFNYFVKESGKVSYGKEHVEEMLNMGAVDILLISEELSDVETERYEELAKDLGTNIEIISTETREGVQLKEMGMIAAILRYNQDHN